MVNCTQHVKLQYTRLHIERPHASARIDQARKGKGWPVLVTIKYRREAGASRARYHQAQGRAGLSVLVCIKYRQGRGRIPESRPGAGTES